MSSLASRLLMVQQKFNSFSWVGLTSLSNSTQDGTVPRIEIIFRTNGRIQMRQDSANLTYGSWKNILEAGFGDLVEMRPFAEDFQDIISHDSTWPNHQDSVTGDPIPGEWRVLDVDREYNLSFNQQYTPGGGPSVNSGTVTFDFRLKATQQHLFSQTIDIFLSRSGPA